jgi:di/tricarboxylate transporter
VAFVAAGLMVAMRCISVASARQSMDWQTLITIAASFGLSKSLENSGLAESAAQWVVQFSHGWSVVSDAVVALAILYLVVMILSELISNNAAAALLLPFGINIAATLGVSPRPFCMAVALAASACFASPIGYQTHLMVWNPGGYKFKDFIRVGVPLDILLWITAVVLIPRVWPF